MSTNNPTFFSQVYADEILSRCPEFFGFSKGSFNLYKNLNSLDKQVKEQVLSITKILEDLISSKVDIKQNHQTLIEYKSACEKYFEQVLTAFANSIKIDTQFFYMALNIGYELSEDSFISYADEKQMHKRELFDALLSEHIEDVAYVTRHYLSDRQLKRATHITYVPNVEGIVERNLFAVMLLKSMGKFDKESILRNVEGIGGGYFYDGVNYGIKFSFNDVNYDFSDFPPRTNHIVRVPHTKKQLELVRKINSMCNNKYFIRTTDDDYIYVPQPSEDE